MLPDQDLATSDAVHSAPDHDSAGQGLSEQGVAGPATPSLSVTASGRTRPAEAWIARSAADGLDEPARRAHNAGFEQREMARHAEFFDRVLAQPLNDEQRAAIVVDEDATLVVASAGSGKTTLLLGKIAYLVMHGLARPEQIALLAFNNSVRAEIRERLASSHDGVAVHTFHSLGLELVRAAQGGACRLSDMATDSAALERFIAETLHEMARKQPALLAEWLAAHQQPLRDATDFASAREWAAWARRHPPRTLSGERIRSHALREVIDRLLLAGIACRTSSSWRVSPGLPPYAPDLFLPDVSLLVDVCGDLVAASGSHGRATDRTGSQGLLRRWVRETLARSACLRHGLRRIRITDAQTLQRGGQLGERLAAALKPFGLDLAPRALPAVLAGKVGAACLADTVSRLAVCLGLQRSGPLGAPPGSHTVVLQMQGADCAGLDRHVSTDPAATHPLSPHSRTISQIAARRQRAFDALFSHVAAAYADHLSARGEIDFGDMVAQAARALDEGGARVPFRYLLVDEFQDISAGRAALVKALRRSRPGMKLLAVGDDWQSIYRFAGSDVSIMARFESHFGHTETRFLRRTFRFDRRVEAVASAFVLRNPAQIRKQVEAREPCSDAPAVVLWLPADADADDPMPGIAAHLLGPPLIVLPLIGQPLPGAPAPPAPMPEPQTPGLPAPRLDILILGRYRHLQGQARLDWLASHYPQATWRFSTIHRAKGATADHAVVLGVRGGRQPFPAERPEDPLLAPFLGAPEAFPHAEERRLFYVALTRARHRVYVVGDRRQPSPFFTELIGQGGDIVVHDRSAVDAKTGADDSDSAGRVGATRAAHGGWDNLRP